MRFDTARDTLPRPAGPTTPCVPAQAVSSRALPDNLSDVPVVQDSVTSLAGTPGSRGDQLDMVDVRDASFEEFVAGSSGRLLTLALLLTGNRRVEAEDLLQDALERAYRRWGRIIREGNPEPYVRQVLVNGSVDRWRRMRRRREEPLAGDGAVVVAGDRIDEFADRDLLLQAMAKLPPRQRAVLVLRYFEDLSEKQTAAILGCGVGTVKSQSSRALARLRQLTTPSLGEPPAEPQAGSDRSHRKGLGSHG